MDFLESKDRSHIIVDSIANGTANNSNGKCKCSNCCNEVIWADNSGNDRCRHNDASDAEASDDENDPKCCEVADLCDGQCTGSCAER